MIGPDDARHGTTRGYHAGCHQACCRAAMARYEKRGRLHRVSGIPRAVPATGAQRRIKALMAIGWNATAIADASGYTHRNQLFRILNGQKGKPCTWVERRTHDVIAEVFEQLAMTIPDRTPVSARTRSLAAKKGYLPPLAWDDIDNDAAPAKTSPGPIKTDVDEAVILRVLSGENLPTTLAEKHEIVRRWKSVGGTEYSICQRMGWKEARYGKDAA